MTKDVIASCYNSKGLCVFQTILTTENGEDSIPLLIDKIKTTIGEHRHGYRDLSYTEVLSALDICMISWS